MPPRARRQHQINASCTRQARLAHCSVWYKVFSELHWHVHPSFFNMFVNSIKSQISRPITFRTSRLIHNTRSIMQNDAGQGKSHASDSALPQGVQDKAPGGLEHNIPDSVHDTGSNKETGNVSHATGDVSSSLCALSTYLSRHSVMPIRIYD